MQTGATQGAETTQDAGGTQAAAQAVPAIVPAPEGHLTTLRVEPIRAPQSAGAANNSGVWVAVTCFAIIATVVGIAVMNELRRRRGEKAQAVMIRASQEREARHNEEYHEAAMRKVNVEHALAKAELRMRHIELGEGEVDGKGLPSRGEMNALVAKKMQLEVELLTTQLELARRELALRGDQLDFHDVQMERTRLEIESLKLRIREQRKGLDEFGESRE
jgi:hypothetical protein